jgi:hypothetical protein
MDEESQHPGEPTAQQLDDAHTLYDAYGDTTGGLNFRGEPMPEWDGLGDTIQRAWINAAAALRTKVEAEAAGE